METYKQCKVILLPTKNTDTILTLYRNNNELSLNNDRLEYHTNQHLYIVSNDEIKIGDWFLDMYNLQESGIQKCTANHINSFQRKGISCNKIIATTDKLLLIPTIPKIYLERYIKLYNLGVKESNVSVEYIEEWVTNKKSKHYNIQDSIQNTKLKTKLNITKNNEIIIL